MNLHSIEMENRHDADVNTNIRPNFFYPHFVSVQCELAFKYSLSVIKINSKKCAHNVNQLAIAELCVVVRLKLLPCLCLSSFVSFHEISTANDEIKNNMREMRRNFVRDIIIIYVIRVEWNKTKTGYRNLKLLTIRDIRRRLAHIFCMIKKILILILSLDY